MDRWECCQHSNVRISVLNLAIKLNQEYVSIGFIAIRRKLRPNVLRGLKMRAHPAHLPFPKRCELPAWIPLPAKDLTIPLFAAQKSSTLIPATNMRTSTHETLLHSSTSGRVVWASASLPVSFEAPDAWANTFAHATRRRVFQLARQLI